MKEPSRMWKKIGISSAVQKHWALYDFANSVFPTMMMTAVLPIFYFNVFAKGLEESDRTAHWGYTAAAALVIIALISPSLGAWGDARRRKKALIAFGTLLGSTASIALAAVEAGAWLWASVVFVIGNIGYAIAELFYESLLPHIAEKSERNRVSAAGYAVGYLGGGLYLTVALAAIQMPEIFGFSDSGAAVRAAFIGVGVWWILFTIPLLRHVPEPMGSNREVHLRFSPLQALKANLQTLNQLRQYRGAFIFLLAFWAYSDGIGTIIKMATVFGKEVGVGEGHLIGAILMVQFLGLPFTLMFGKIASKIGEKTSLMITLVVYAIVCVIGYFLEHAWQFWLLAFLVSMVQGAAQSLSRSIFSQLIPAEKSGEFFGFYSVSSRFAGIIGPLLFAALTQLGGSSRISILAITSLFFIGILLLTKVDMESCQENA